MNEQWDHQIIALRAAADRASKALRCVMRMSPVTWPTPCARTLI